MFNINKMLSIYNSPKSLLDVRNYIIDFLKLSPDLPIDQDIISVRSIIKSECRLSINSNTLMLIEIISKDEVFIIPTGSSHQIHSRDELINLFPFNEFGKMPEEILNQQKVYIYTAMINGKMDIDCVVSDSESTIPTMATKDLVRQSLSKVKLDPLYSLLAEFKIRVYVGKEKFDDFKGLGKIVRGVMNISGSTSIIDKLLTNKSEILMIQQGEQQREINEQCKAETVIITERVNVLETQRKTENEIITDRLNKLDEQQEKITEQLGRIDASIHELKESIQSIMLFFALKP